MRNILLLAFLMMLNQLCYAQEDDLTAKLTYGSAQNGYKGAIDLTVKGGLEPYTFQWTGPNNFKATTEDINNLPANSSSEYCVTVTDAICGEATLCVQMKKCQDLQIVGTINKGTCGQNNSSISIQITDNDTYTPNKTYAYQWSNGATTRDLNNLKGGNYCVTVTSGSGCKTTKCFDVTENSTFEVKLASYTNKKNCNGGTGGNISVDVTGNGKSPYTYFWIEEDNRTFTSTSKDLTNLNTGFYALTVTDANGCKAYLGQRICCCGDNFGGNTNIQGECVANSDYQRTPIDVQLDAISPKTASEKTGSIRMTYTNDPIGRTTFKWSGPNGFAAYSQNINNLGIGSYCVTVTNGCVSTTKCVDLIACDQANITVNQMAIKHTCNCSCAFGEISVSASGGNSPYTYQWSTGSTSTTVKNLAAGQYSVTAKSYSGCYSKPTNFSINNSQPFEQKVNNKDCTDEYYCNGNLVPSLTKPAPRTEQYNASDCGYMDLVCSRTGAVIQYKYRPVEYAQTNVRNNNNCTIEDICRNGGRVIRYQGNKRDEEGIFYDQRGNSYCGKATICNLGDGDFISNFVEYGFQEYRTVIDCKDEHNTSGVIIDVYCAKNRIYSYCKPSVVFKGEDSPSFQKNEHLDITNLQLRRVEKPSFLSKNTLTLYPNPFSSDFNIDFYSDKDQNIRINIIDLMGRKVEQKQEKVLIGSNNITLSAPNLFKGLYWVEVIDAENHKLMGKITKM